MTVAAILLAGGSSSRMGAAGKKELLAAGGKPVLVRAAESFAVIPEIDTMVLVHPAGEEALFRSLPRPFKGRLLFVEGGATRQRSVINALEVLKDTPPEAVLIHDGARPFVTPGDIMAVLDGVKKHGACLPVVPAVYALKEIDSDGWVTRHLDRSEIKIAQTPQGFLYPAIYGAHRQAIALSDAFTDDSEIWSRFVGTIFSVAGNPDNIKITYPSDLARLS